jgi:hypothetical protein
MILLFLVVLFVLFVAECILLETEKFGWATITLVACFIASVVLGRWFHVYSVLDFIKDHGVWTLVYACAYVGVGVAWSFVKWFSFLMGFRDAYRQVKEGFYKAHSLPADAVIPENLKTAYKEYVHQNSPWGSAYRYDIAALTRPRASKNKSRITAWACYWPFSFVGTLLNDPVRRLFNFLFNQFKAQYQRLSDYVLRKDTELQ